MPRARAQGEERGRGLPLSDSERRYRHYEQTGDWPDTLPPRGTGLQKNVRGIGGFIRLNNEWMWLAIGAIGIIAYVMVRKSKIQRR